MLEVEHGLHVHGAGLGSGLLQHLVLRHVLLRGTPLGHRPTFGQVAVDEVVGRRLIGHQVGLQATGLGAAHQLGQNFCGIAQQRNRHRLFGCGVLLDQLKRMVDVARLLVHVARAQTEVDAALLAFNVERHRSRKRGRERLCTAHAAQACGQYPLAFE
ncbi:hypothetical protein D3C71_1178630 [compost metagenome]